MADSADDQCGAASIRVCNISLGWDETKQAHAKVNHLQKATSTDPQPADENPENVEIVAPQTEKLCCHPPPELFRPSCSSVYLAWQSTGVRILHMFG